MGKLSIYLTAARKAFLGSPRPGRGSLALAAVLFVLTALVAFWNVDNRDGVHCGSWLFPNNVLAEHADAAKRTIDAQAALDGALLQSQGNIGGPMDPPRFTTGTNAGANPQVAGCQDARSGRTPVIVVGGVATLAALVIGVLRRYQPRKPGP